MHPAMVLRGVQARFVDPERGSRVYPKSHPYQISDYLNAAVEADLEIRRVVESACGAQHVEVSDRARKYKDWPLLLAFKLGIR